MKKKAVQIIMCSILCLVILYTGICCGATLHRAGTQPYLTADAARLEFLGYSIMAAVYGAACLGCSILLLLLLFKRNHRRKAT